MNLPKTLEIRPGHKEAFEKAVRAYDEIANGTLGFGGQARLFVELGFDKQILKRRGKRWPNKRIRRKQMKRTLRGTYTQNILDCLVGFGHA